MAQFLSIASKLLLCISFAFLLFSATAIEAWRPYQPQSTHGYYMTDQKRGLGSGNLHPSECGGRCAYRCSATSHKKPCMFFCQKCCAKCLCVPPGTYGNKQQCPCYNNWKTQQGGPKCP